MAVSTPAAPTSGTPVANPTGEFVSVAVTGGTVTNVVVNGTSVGTGLGSYQLPPGGTITVTYTGTLTWAWSAPLDLGYTPGFPNTFNSQAEAAGWSPYTALPYAQHAALGQAGLATG